MELQRIKPMTIGEALGRDDPDRQEEAEGPGEANVPELRAICKFLKFPDDVKLNIL